MQAKEWLGLECVLSKGRRTNTDKTKFPDKNQTENCAGDECGNTLDDAEDRSIHDFHERKSKPLRCESGTKQTVNLLRILTQV